MDRVTPPVAIVGMACRFPGGGDLEAFRALLTAGGDAVQEGTPGSGEGRVGKLFRKARPAPDPRRFGAFVDGVDRFDAAFFGIPAAEARLLDPQQRLLLETSWGALEHAAIPPDSLQGSRTAVFAGIGGSDYRDLIPTAGADSALRELAGRYHGIRNEHHTRGHPGGARQGRVVLPPR